MGILPQDAEGARRHFASVLGFIRSEEPIKLSPNQAGQNGTEGEQRFEEEGLIPQGTDTVNLCSDARLNCGKSAEVIVPMKGKDRTVTVLENHERRTAQNAEN